MIDRNYYVNDHAVVDEGVEIGEGTTEVQLMVIARQIGL